MTIGFSNLDSAEVVKFSQEYSTTQATCQGNISISVYWFDEILISADYGPSDKVLDIK